MKRKRGGRECSICKICKDIEDANYLVHKEKFEKTLSLDEVVKGLAILTGRMFPLYVLQYHYQKHLDPVLAIEYKKQAQVLSNPKKFRERLDKARKSVKSHKRSTKFDAMEQLKKMYLDLNERLFRFESDYGKSVTPENVKTYSVIVEELRKLASDISRVELDREYIGKVILEVYRDLVIEMTEKMGDLVRNLLLKLAVDQKEKKEIIEEIKKRMVIILSNAVVKLEKDLMKRL